MVHVMPLPGECAGARSENDGVSSRNADWGSERQSNIMHAGSTNRWSDSMRLLASAALAAFLAAASSPSGATALSGVNQPGYAGSSVHAVAYRRCTIRQGRRHCRNVEPRRAPSEQTERGYGYDYGTPPPEFYPTGSSAWWQAMEREGRTGRSRD
jgi:hypothetical protein